jgi:hypothetical protein
VTGKGIDELKYAMAEKVEELRSASPRAEEDLAENAELQKKA